MGGITKHEILLKGIKFEYFTAGEGPVFFIVPAFHSDIERLEALVVYLSRYFKVILPHLPGVCNGQPMGHYKYSIENFARFINLLVEELKLKDYILSGVCLGGPIVIRMLEYGVKKPNHVVIFEGVYDADYIHLEPFYEVVRKIAIKLGPKDRLLNSVMDLFLHDEKVMQMYFNYKYRKEKNADEIIKHQIEQTEKMSTRGYVEVALDVFNLHLARENITFDTPATLVYNAYDNIFDLEKMIAGMRKIFPNSKVISTNLTNHSPANKIDIGYVKRMVGPIKKDLFELSIRLTKGFIPRSRVFFNYYLGI